MNSCRLPFEEVFHYVFTFYAISYKHVFPRYDDDDASLMFVTSMSMKPPENVNSNQIQSIDGLPACIGEDLSKAFQFLPSFYCPLNTRVLLFNVGLKIAPFAVFERPRKVPSFSGSLEDERTLSNVFTQTVKVTKKGGEEKKKRLLSMGFI